MDPEQLYQEFKNQLEELFERAEQSIKAGEEYSREDILYWIGDIVEMFERNLEDEGFNRPDMVVRSQDYAHEQYNKFNDLYPLSDKSHSASIVEEDDDRENNSITTDSVLGFPIISEMECEDSQESSVRGQILLTVQELAEYLDPVPESVIRGIVIRFDENGEFAGFSLCGNRDTQ